MFRLISGNRQSGWANGTISKKGLGYSRRRESNTTIEMSRSSIGTSVIVNGEQPHYSPTTGLVYIFNLIVGTGALTLPAAFHDAG